MNRAKAILGACLLSTAVLAAGCAVDAGDQTSDETPSAATAEADQPVIISDLVTGTYQIDAATLDLAAFPYSVVINGEVRGTLESPDDVLELEAPPDAEVILRSRYADEAGV